MPYYPSTLSERKGRGPQAPRSYDKSKLYGTRWQRYRKAYLQRHPLCVVCGQDGRIVAADTVDHVKPHRGDYHKFWCGEDGLQPMCKFHHDQKTGRGQ